MKWHQLTFNSDFMFASAWVCEEVDLDRRFTDRLLARRRVLRHRHCTPASSNSNKSLQPRSRRNTAQCAWRPGINLSTSRSVISPNFIKGRLITFINMWYASVLWRCQLGGRKGIPHPACKTLSGGCWRGYLSGVRCRLAYGPADAIATHCLLLQ